VTVRYEAESAFLSRGSVRATDHGNFSGSGFVDMANESGSYVEWRVTIATAGQVTLRVRYAIGTFSGRSCDLSVNGIPVSRDVVYPSTGSWDSWQTWTYTVGLPAGTSTVRVTGTGSAGGPNLDYLEVVA
jgi:hypothetical protein